MSGAIFQIISRHGRRILSSSPFTKYLLVTNVVVGGVIDCCGDLIAQRVLEKSDSTSWSRNRRMITMAVVLSAPAHFWYLYLDRLFPLRTRAHVVKKVLLDVFIAGPPFLSAFFLGMSQMEGSTWKQSVTELKEKFPPTYMVEMVFWPVAQVINFYFLPLSLRLVYVNCMALVWSVALSTFKHNEIKMPELFRK